MIYKFKSKATGDVIMLGPNGDQLLQLLGREPAPKGIIEVADMGAAIVALQRAVQEEEARVAEGGVAAGASGASGKGVSLRQRLWPMVEMFKQAQAAKESVVWGV
jgi:Domain of unknown function (DUF1840)